MSAVLSPAAVLNTTLGYLSSNMEPDLTADVPWLMRGEMRGAK